MNQKAKAIRLITKIFLFIVFLPIVLIWLIWKKTDWKKRDQWFATAGIAVVFLCFIFFLIENNKPVPKEAVLSVPQTEELKTIPAAIVPDPTQETVKVERVIDGDTIKLEDGRTVRYIGIDAPETVDPKKPVQCFGPEASSADKKLVEGQTVRMEKDVSDKDMYGRLLRYVWVGDTFVNDYLVRNGYARLDTFPPDTKYEQEFKAAQAEAKNAKRGLWTACQ